MVLGGFHVYKSVFLGWVVGRFNIAVNGEHNCGVPPYTWLTKAVERRSIASKVRADVKVVSLLFLASFRISTYAPVM